MMIGKHQDWPDSDWFLYRKTMRDVFDANLGFGYFHEVDHSRVFIAFDDQSFSVRSLKRMSEEFESAMR